MESLSSSSSGDKVRKCGRLAKLSVIVVVAVAVLATLVSPANARIVPGTPTGVEAVYNEKTASFTLLWTGPQPTAAGPIAGYEVIRDGEPVGTSFGYPFFSDSSDLTAGKTYEYEVRAFSGPRNQRRYGAATEPVAVAARTLVGPPALVAQADSTPGRVVDGRCIGGRRNTAELAQTAYNTDCNDTYNPSSGVHRCEWIPPNLGYECSGPTGDGGGVTPPPNDPGTDDPGTDDPLPPDPNVGGPTGNGPLVPRDVRAVAVTNDTEAVNPAGIRLSWTPGGGPESLGFNISRAEVDGAPREHLISIVGRSWFVDCNVVKDTTYQYTVSAWSEGSVYSFTTLPVEAKATVTPGKCRPLTPPGPSGENEPSTDPLFTSNTRNLNKRPATPEQVKITGSGSSARLQWEMPPSARMVFQITRNALREAESEELWGQFQITPGHQDMTFSNRGDGGARMSIPVGKFSPGDNFVIQASHPWSIEEDELGPDARFSKQSRFATIVKPGKGKEIPNFYDSFDADPDTNLKPEGSWIGSKGDWNPVPQFDDQFDGSGKLADANDKWFFARNDGERELTPSWSRDQTQTDKNAILKDGKLEMSAKISDGSYSYFGSANDSGDGYLVDPTNGVFVEASVRLDHMSPADNAWWAFWLMAPGSSNCDANGNPIPGGSNAYDGHAETGVELDLFEFVPDLNNGYNQALFRYEGGQGDNCVKPDGVKLAPEGRNFTYEGVNPPLDVDMPDYMDGDYHRLGLYYAQDCYVVYMDDELMWKVTEESHPGWITKRAKESIRLTWEIQNQRTTANGDVIKNPWTSRGGDFSNTALERDPTVFIDYVNVWEKKEAANGLCSGGADPAPEPEPEPDPELEAPVNVVAVPEGGTIQLNWEAGEGLAPSGYDILRDEQVGEQAEELVGEDHGYWSLTDGETEFPDEIVDAGQTYDYQIVPWTAGANGAIALRTYGPKSDVVSATAEEGSLVNGMGAPTSAVATRDGGAIWVNWTAGEGTPPDGYDVKRNSDIPWSVVGENRFLDTAITDGQVYTYIVTPWVETDGDPANRLYGAASAETSATGGSGPIPDLEPPHDPDPNAGPNYRRIFRDDFEGADISSNFAVPSWTAPSRVTKNSAAGCSQKDGKLHLAIKQVGDEQLACFLISNAGNYGPGIDSTVKIEYRANVSNVKAMGAWFAGWVYPLGDTSGQPNAADGVVTTGSEYDVFEYMPTRPGEFQTAVHDSDAIKMEKWVDPQSLGIDLTADEFHTFGVEWNKNCVAFFIDGTKVSSKNSDISAAKKHSLMLSMEAQTGTQWDTWDVGDFAENLASNPAEGIIDWVEVQKKKSLDPELCDGSDDPGTDDPGTDDPGTDPRGPSAVRDLKRARGLINVLALVWAPPAEPDGVVDGYEIYRDGEFHDRKANEAFTGHPDGYKEWTDHSPNGATRQHVYTIYAYTELPGGEIILGEEASIYTSPDNDGGYGDGPPPVDSFSLLTRGLEAVETGRLVFEFVPQFGARVTGYKLRVDGKRWKETGAGEPESDPDADRSIEFYWSNSGPIPDPGEHDVTIYSFNRDENGNDVLSAGRTISYFVADNGFVQTFEKPLLAPVEDLVATQTRFKPEIVLKWRPQEFAGYAAGDITEPSGYNVERNGTFYKSVVGSPLYDPDVVPGEEYWYKVTPYFNQSSGDALAGPSNSTSPLLVKETPTVIDPDAPTDLTAIQVDRAGRSVELTWIAPEGWEQGLIKYYTVTRNGFVVAQLPENTFDDFETTAYRTFTDSQASAGVTTSYSVVAYSTEGSDSEGARSEPVIITPTRLSDEEDPGSEPSTEEIPGRYVRAVEIVFGVSGSEASRLGAEFYTLHQYVDRGVSTLDYSRLLQSFNFSAIGSGYDTGLTPGEAALARISDGEDLLTRIATQSGGPNGHLLGIIPELYSPPGYDGLQYLGNWAGDRGLEPKEQKEGIEKHLELLRKRLDEVDDGVDSKLQWKHVRFEATEVVWHTLNFTNAYQDHTHDAWYRGVRSGLMPNHPIYETGSVAAGLFYQATEQERVEFYEVDQFAWQFVQPYIDIQLMAQDTLDDKRRQALRKYVAGAITLIATGATFGKAITLKSAFFTAFAGFASTLALTSDLREAGKAFVQSLVTSGLASFGEGTALAEKLGGWDVVAYSSLRAIDKYLKTGKWEDAAIAFTDAVLEKYGQNYFDADLWTKIQPFVEISMDILWQAILTGGVDWDQAQDQYLNGLFSLMGQEFGEFVADSLPQSWGGFRGPIADLAQTAVVTGGDKAKIRQHFDQKTLPAMANLIGSNITDRIGKDKLLGQITGPLVELGLNYANPEFSNAEATRMFEEVIHGIVGKYVEDELKFGLRGLNTSGNQNINVVIDKAAELAGVYITYSYDSSLRDEKVLEFGTDTIVEVLLGVMPNCVADSPAVQTITGELVAAATTGGGIEDEDLVSLAESGVWAGKEIAENCGGSDDDVPGDASKFTQWVLDLAPGEISFTNVGEDRVLVVPAEYSNNRLTLSSERSVINSETAIAEIFSRETSGEAWGNVAATVVAKYGSSTDDTVVDFLPDSVCPQPETSAQVTASSGASTAGRSGNVFGGSGVGLLLPTPTLASAPLLQINECPLYPDTAKGFRDLLINTQRLDIASELNVEIGNLASGAKHWIVTTKQGHQRFRLIAPYQNTGEIQGKIQTIEFSSGNWNNVRQAPPVVVFAENNQLVDFKESATGKLDAELLIGMEPSEIDALVKTPDNVNGVVFESYSLAGQPDIRVRITDDLGVLETRSRSMPNRWLSANGFVEVERSGNTIVNFKAVDDGRADLMIDALFKLAASLLTVPTSSEELFLVTQQFKGCASAFGDTIAGLWNLLRDVFKDIPGAIERLKIVVPELLAVFAANPDGFIEEVLVNFLNVDELAAARAADSPAAEAVWQGRLRCEVAISLAATGRTPRVFKPGTHEDFVRKAENGEFDQYKTPRVGCNSFPTGTLVRMADGSLRPIDAIRPGDRVLAANEVTGKWSPRAVIDQWSHNDTGRMATVTLTDGSHVSATDHHLFWVTNDGAWVELEDVQPGDYLLTPDGITEVASVDLSDNQETLVWELDVATDDTFAVYTGTSDVLVHNAKCPITQEEIDVITENFPPARVGVVDVSNAPKFLGKDKPPESKDSNGNWVGGWREAPNPENWVGEIYIIEGKGYAYEINGYVVLYNLDGYPDFTPYAIASVDIGPFTGSRKGDFKAANGKIERKDFGNEAPQGFTWHHVEAKHIEGTPMTDGGGLMELVDEKAHDLFKHSGGFSTTK